MRREPRRRARDLPPARHAGAGLRAALTSGWSGARLTAVALGGAAGAVVRWAVVTGTAGTGWLPWPVLAINAAGSLVLGVLLAEEWSHPRARLLLHDAGAIGFCGGLTTFSTLAVEVVDLVRIHRTGAAAAYGGLSLVLTVGGVLVGAGLLARVRAAGAPVEEEP